MGRCKVQQLSVTGIIISVNSLLMLAVIQLSNRVPAATGPLTLLRWGIALRSFDIVLWSSGAGPASLFLWPLPPMQSQIGVDGCTALFARIRKLYSAQTRGIS